ncbi:MAG TPA: hypothetical protein VFK10_19245 [Burkholderiaceae bacterium]|nr:hypothetical protein [Burkholderiaceae bacterium]
MGPSRIMIIRHAEKPIPGRVKGVRARGELDEASLTALGWQRAGALVSYFQKPRTSHIICPDHLFAVRFDLAGAASSRRSRQTLNPLSRALGIRIDDRFGEGQESQLAQAVQKVSGAVLIAWAHEQIPKLIEYFGFGVNTPRAWPDERFDLVWVFEPLKRRTTFVQVPQLLLAGDSESGIPLASDK